MPEMNPQPPEGPEETPRQDEFAGYMDEKDLPAGETDDASRRAADILARALSRAEATLNEPLPESEYNEEPPEDIPPEDVYPWEPTQQPPPAQPPEPSVPHEPPYEPPAQPPEPSVPPQPASPTSQETTDQMQEFMRSLAEHFDAAFQQMAEERHALIQETQVANQAAREQTQQALEQMQELPRVLKEQFDAALQGMAEERRAFTEEAGSVDRSAMEQRQEVPQALAEHFTNALDRMAEERRSLVDEAVAASRASREQADRMLEQMQELVRSLTEHFDRALDRMSEERRLLVDEAQVAGRSGREQTERTLDRMDQDRRFLGEQMATLTRALERLETRFDDLNRVVADSRRVPTTVATEEQPLPVEEKEAEPSFEPGGEGLTLVISAVPGFQGLMEVQRALTRVPAIEGASVERYFDGEARIVLTLREPITAARLLEALTEAAGQELQIEESRPDAMRMRVRFQASEE